MVIDGPSHVELTVLEAGCQNARDRVDERALRSLDLDVLALQGDANALGHRNRFPSNPRHVPRYQTRASSSPPIFCFRLSRSVMTPLEVDRMASPMPPRIEGILSAVT